MFRSKSRRLVAPLQPFPQRQGLAVPRAFGQHLAQEALGLGVVAAFGGQDRQVAPGDMPKDPLVDAAKLVRDA